MKSTSTLLSLLLAATLSAAPSIDVLSELTQRPGNPAVAPDGTIYFSMHPFDSPEYKVMKLEDGTGTPFPNKELSSSFSAVIGIQVDALSRVWILDMGSAKQSAKLLAWDTATDQLHQVIYLPKEVLAANSFVQDFALDQKRGQAYIADMSRGGMIDASEPAIIVVDLNTGHSRRMLQSHPFLQADADKTMIVEGKPGTFTDDDGQSQALQLGLNPIAIDAQNEWVYFSTIHAGTLYRIPAKLLADKHADDATLVAAIQDFAPKPTSDGIAADGTGRIYITNLEDNAISIADSSGTRI